MRWFWIDRFIEFESGRRARAVKNVSLAEEHVHDHLPGAPLMPASLVTEGIAQTGGLLVGQCNDYEKRVVLAKISRIRFHFHPEPGDTLIYETVIESLQPDGAIVSASSHVGDRLQAEAEIFFAHLDGRHQDRQLFEPRDFLVTLRILGVFDVGRNADGSKISVPPKMLAAEARANE